MSTIIEKNNVAKKKKTQHKKTNKKTHPPKHTQNNVSPSYWGPKPSLVDHIKLTITVMSGHPNQPPHAPESSRYRQSVTGCPPFPRLYRGG